MCVSLSLIVTEPKVELFLDVKSVLGETPIYDYRSNDIIWVDIDGMSINVLNVVTRNNRVIDFKDFVGAAIPCTSGTNLLAVSKQNIILVDKMTGQYNDFTNNLISLLWIPMGMRGWGIL